MLKNKIYKYFSLEILRNFLVILFAFSSIVWTVRSVNFLELIVDNGHSVKTYLYFSFLNLSNVVTKLIPISFFFALLVSIIKFDRQNELLSLWTSGVSKIKLVNLFFFLSILIFLLQLFFAVFITPSALNKSREIVRTSDIGSINSLIKSNDFSDAFESLTFFVEEKDSNNELKNIFIRDENNTFKSLVSDQGKSSNTTIFAKSGSINKKKLILQSGIIQSQNNDGKINIVEFERTELSLVKLSTGFIINPKIQETHTFNILTCLIKNRKKDLQEKFIKNCPNHRTNDLIETVSRRMGMPLYIPILSLIGSFLLFSRRSKKYNFVDKYIFGFYGFVILVLAEILVRYSGFSNLNTSLYFLTPIIITPIIYFYLIKKVKSEKI